MVLLVQKEINRRAVERKYFNQKVRWIHKSDDSIESEALDMSPWGMFVSSEGKMIEKMNVNDPVTIVIDIGKEKFSLQARICWSGNSSMHSKRGFGLEFDEESLELANELMLKVDEQGVFFVPE